MPDQITTTVEAARQLGVTPASVRALTARGTLPAGPPWTPQQLADARAHRGGSIPRLNGHIPHHGAAGVTAVVQVAERLPGPRTANPSFIRLYLLSCQTLFKGPAPLPAARGFTPHDHSQRGANQSSTRCW